MNYYRKIKESQMTLVKRNKRLVELSSKPDVRFWSDHWQDVSIDEAIASARNDVVLRDIFYKYLPRNRNILEAGCGLGQWVKVLKGEGYEIEGVDFSKETIEKVKKYDSTLPVKVADVLDLPYPDNYFGGYVSLGVMEHFEEGPEGVLKEAFRVLKNQGIIIASVPYFNLIKKIKSELGLYGKTKEGAFYQYYFTKREFADILKQTGFRPLAITPYDANTELSETTPFKWFSYCLKRREDASSKKIKKGLRKASYLYPFRGLAGHMVIFIAELQKDKRSK